MVFSTCARAARGLASLVRASSILQSEIERRSRAKGSRPGALAAWQIARVRAFIDFLAAELVGRVLKIPGLSNVEDPPVSDEADRGTVAIEVQDTSSS